MELERWLLWQRQAYQLWSNQTLYEASILLAMRKLKGDIHINILNDFDKEIKAGEYFLIYQNQSAVGLGRAIAPAWEWAGTRGTSKTSPKIMNWISAYRKPIGHQSG